MLMLFRQIHRLSVLRKYFFVGKTKDIRWLCLKQFFLLVVIGDNRKLTFSFPLLATEMARRSTMQVRTATIGHVPSTRRLTGTT